MKYDQFYLDQISLSDLEIGEPVYMTDGMFLLTNGKLVEETSEEYKRYWRKYYEHGTRSW
jgi:hypothetical protein